VRIFSAISLFSSARMGNRALTIATNCSIATPSDSQIATP
jgi:hypothetical protein